MKRAAFLSVITTILLLIWALWLLPYVKVKSTSLVLDLVVILLWTGLILGASWWEIDWILPQKAVPQEEIGKLRRLKLGRSLLLVLAIFANFAWTDLAAGEFWFSYYSKYGVYATAMRSNQPQKQLWALKRSALVITPDFVLGMAPSVRPLTKSPDPAVKGRAFAWFGYGIRQMRLLLATNAPVKVKEKARRVKEVLSADLSGLALCLQNEKGRALEGCLYAAGWISKQEFLGLITDVVARTKDQDCLVAAAEACRNIGGIRALSILADLVRDTRGLARQAAVFAYLKTAALMIDLKDEDVESPVFDKSERQVASLITGFGTICVFLQHFPDLRDARFTKTLATLVDQLKGPKICPDIEVHPPVGAPFSLSVRRDYYVCVVNAIAGIAKNNLVLIRAIKGRLQHRTDPRLNRLLQRVLNAAK